LSNTVSYHWFYLHQTDSLHLLSYMDYSLVYRYHILLHFTVILVIIYTYLVCWLEASYLLAVFVPVEPQYWYEGLNRSWSCKMRKNNIISGLLMLVYITFKHNTLYTHIIAGYGAMFRCVGIISSRPLDIMFKCLLTKTSICTRIVCSGVNAAG